MSDGRSGGFGDDRRPEPIRLPDGRPGPPLPRQPTRDELARDAPPLDHTLPANPEAYDSPRAEQARRKGLKAPYIAGGTDPNPEAARREERRYLWLLVAMIVVIVLAGYVLGFLGNVFGG